ncbi:DUF1365 domain-containing protein [Paremcibacter congregatus]|uniref:DUF1365 domain-containing protein n=1 Tax=Paremcibacter congregatus TaxID=2043170 RepID=UPI003A8F6FA6
MKNLSSAPLRHPGLFPGAVWHKRNHTKSHQFKYPVFYLLLDLDEITVGTSGSAFLSHNRFNFFSFHDKDYGLEKHRPLKNQIADLLIENRITAPLGKVMMLTMPRVLGYGFNPITVYYCHNRKNHIIAVLYEVHNTFGDRHIYVCAAQQDGGMILPHLTPKKLHVSPFFNQDGCYRFHHKITENHLALTIDYHPTNETTAPPGLTACFSGKRQPLTSGNLLRLFLRIPFMTFKVIISIHWQALLLWAKGLKVFRNPGLPPKISRN